MKIKIENNLVELTPENDGEVRDLDGLWKTVVDCVKFNKKLVAIGEYVPGRDAVAQFAIEE